MEHRNIENDVHDLMQICINKFDSLTDGDLIEEFRKSLTGRYENLTKEVYENTYLKNLEIPQIQLFDILANRFPLVIEAQNIIGRALIESIKEKKNITIIDLGIGRCIQVQRLLHLINNVPNIQSVTLIGVDISADSIAFSGKVLEEIQNKLHFKMEIHLFNKTVEDIEDLRIQSLIPLSNDFLFVNASLTLHHIQSKNDRLRLFKLVSLLKPDLFTLIEPNTDFFNTNFEQRMVNAFEHFGSLFSFINTLPLLTKEKKGLKSFFSNELFDALAIPEDGRYEKYDLSENWVSLGTNLGLKVFKLDSFSDQTYIPGIEIENKSIDYVNFKVNNSNLLGVIAFSS